MSEHENSQFLLWNQVFSGFKIRQINFEIQILTCKAPQLTGSCQTWYSIRDSEEFFALFLRT